jgi:hypothetical protein
VVVSSEAIRNTVNWRKWEYSETIYHLFIGFKTTCDSARRKVLYSILIEFRIPMKLVRIIKTCLNETYNKVCIGNHLIWRVSSSGMWRRVVCWVATDVSEEHIASIFRVEEIISASKQVLVLAELFLKPWRWRRYVPPKLRLQLSRLHGVISQKMILFMYLSVGFEVLTQWQSAFCSVVMPCSLEKA